MIWAVYGSNPHTGEVWRVTDEEGFDAIPYFGAMLVYQPGTGERPVRNCTWIMWRSDVGAWIGAEDDGSALEKHILFPAITCTRRCYYDLEKPWEAVKALMDADRDELEGR